jgi:hypothetical protein
MLGLAILALVAAPALADYYVAGDFNGSSATGQIMTEGPAGEFSADVTGAVGRHEFKVTIGDWAQNWPGDNARADFGDTGNLTIKYYPTPAADGWNPPANRVGYVDNGLHGWDIMGSFNGWSTPVVDLTPLGNGRYDGDYTVPVAGDYFFKFRIAGDWDITVGSDFSNYGHDIPVSTAADNTTLRFHLDLNGGRWMTEVVPEPASLLVALLGLALRRR